MNGFTGPITTCSRATGRATASIVMAMAMAMAQDALFVAAVMLATMWFGASGVIRAMTVTETVVFPGGVVPWRTSRSAIARALADAGHERAERALHLAVAG